MIHPFHRRALDRRTLLKSGLAALALPWLDAMQPALASQRIQRRALFIFSPNGMKMDDWRPKAAGPIKEWPHILQPLQSLASQVRVMGGMTNNWARPHGDGPGGHARAAGVYLTCVHPKKTGGSNIRAGVSIDQRLAPSLARPDHAFRTLELGMEGGRLAGKCDSGYSCAYSNNISWRSPTTPVSKETDPRAVFMRLFGDPRVVATPEERALKQRNRKSLLDGALESVAELKRELGRQDRTKLDQYLYAVRELETRLDTADVAMADEQVSAPDGIMRGQHFQTRIDLMYEVLALAFQTDSTPVATFMVGNAGSNRSYRWLGVRAGHHDLSHHQKKADRLGSIRKINRWHMERFAAFLQRLQSTPDGNGSLLDSSAIVFGCGLADGNAHDHHSLPILLCGGYGGSLVPGGSYLKHPKETPLANLYSQLTSIAGDRALFGDAKEPLAGLRRPS